MVSPLKYYKRDPESRNRGAGFYYKRYSMPRGTRTVPVWYSRYTGTKMPGGGMDGERRPIHKTRSLRYSHTGDFVLGKRTRFGVTPKGNLSKKKVLPFGFL
jgi:hypothetical protein